VDGAGRESEARFAACVESLAGVLGHADRAGPLLDYCTGLLMPCAASRRMARRRMARGRGGADQILALDLARGHAARGSRRRHQAAMAHRTRLRGIEERTGPCSLRGARLAGIPSSRQPLHRSLRIPDPREISFSPLSAPAPRKTCPFRPFSIPSRPQSVPNATWPTRSPQCASY
jgi:hypothetical protein